MKRRYGGYISGIKQGTCHSQPHFVTADSRTDAVVKLKQAAQEQYPPEEGWRNHAVSHADGLVDLICLPE